MTREATKLQFQKLPVGAEWNDSTKLGHWDKSRDPIKHIIIHTIVGTIPGANQTFNNPAKKTSAHYGVGLDGKLYQWLQEDFTAYHAGNLAMNRQSIGIEHEDGFNPKTRPNAYNEPRPDSLYETSAKLVYDICTFYGLPIDRNTVKAHREVSTTSCCDALDIERIVREAAAMGRSSKAPINPASSLSPQLSPVFNSVPLKSDINPVTKKPYATNPMTGNWDDSYWSEVVEPEILKRLVKSGQTPEPSYSDEQKTIQLLKDALPNIKTKDGQSFSDLSTLALALLANNVSYIELLHTVDQKRTDMDEIVAKANNYDAIANYFKVPEAKRTQVNGGDLVISQYEKDIKFQSDKLIEENKILTEKVSTLESTKNAIASISSTPTETLTAYNAGSLSPWWDQPVEDVIAHIINYFRGNRGSK